MWWCDRPHDNHLLSEGCDDCPQIQYDEFLQNYRPVHYRIVCRSDEANWWSSCIGTLIQWHWKRFFVCRYNHIRHRDSQNDYILPKILDLRKCLRSKNLLQWYSARRVHTKTRLQHLDCYYYYSARLPIQLPVIPGLSILRVVASRYLETSRDIGIVHFRL